jgi:hypothetical protein
VAAFGAERHLGRAVQHRVALKIGATMPRASHQTFGRPPEQNGEACAEKNLSDSSKKCSKGPPQFLGHLASLAAPTLVQNGAATDPPKETLKAKRLNPDAVPSAVQAAAHDGNPKLNGEFQCQLLPKDRRATRETTQQTTPHTVGPNDKCHGQTTQQTGNNDEPHTTHDVETQSVTADSNSVPPSQVMFVYGGTPPEGPLFKNANLLSNRSSNRGRHR